MNQPATESDPTPPTLYERQALLEEDMQRLGVARIRKHLDDAKKRGEEMGTVYGKDLLTYSLPKVTEGVAAYLADIRAGKARKSAKAFEVFDQLESETIAYYGLKVILSRVARAPLTSTAIAIGTLCEDELRHRYYAEKEPGLWVVTKRRVEKDAKHSYKRARTAARMRMEGLGVEYDEVIPHDVKVHAGTRLIEIIQETTGLFTLEIIKDDYKKQQWVLVPSAETVEWIGKRVARCELTSAEFLPCLLKPRPWVSPVGGGYHTTHVRRLRLVKSRSKPYLDELFARSESGQLDGVYRAVNALQDTAWRINRPVYDVMKTLWDSHAEVPVIPNRDNEYLPTKPLDIATNKQSRRDWRKSAAKVYTRNRRLGSTRFLMSKLLSLAGRFVDEEAIYYPHQLDFRGRAYPVPSFLQPQGADDAKGLLTFANGIPIDTQEAADWLAIHGANLWGYDKVSLQARVDWVTENLEMIISTALQPLDDQRWMKADKPWQFLAFCFDYNGFIERGFGYCSSLPVSVDGTCNGLQHFSAMLRDPIGGAAVNLIPSEKPRDIYQDVADLVITYLESMPDNSLAYQWLQFGVTRKTVKRPVMVLPYGGTHYGCRAFMVEAIQDGIMDGKSDIFGGPKMHEKAASFIAAHVWHAIGEVVVAAKIAMFWLQQAAKVVTAEGFPINWTTPSGFLVQQRYLKRKVRDLKITLKTGFVQLGVEEDTTAIDAERQKNGISPNFVHSMDASALMSTVNASLDAGVQSFSMVHDSYGTHAAHMQTLGVALRASFVQMYEKDVLAGFREEVSKVLLTSEIGTAPIRGSLDLDGILTSDFFFA